MTTRIPFGQKSSARGTSQLDYAIIVGLVFGVALIALLMFGKDLRCKFIEYSYGMGGGSFRSDFGTCGSPGFTPADLDNDGCVSQDDFNLYVQETQCIPFY